MASYHLCCKVISRGQGRSATAAAAYRAAERIYDRRTGLEHDYERKRGVVRSEVLLPRDAPEIYRDRGELWNAVEAAETRSNSRLSREFELALPRELCRDEQFDLARGWAERELVSRGMCADVCMHDRGDGNPHAHIMCTTREAGPDGFGAKNRGWDDKALLVDLRKSWEREQNRALERSYERDRTPEIERSYVDCRSYEARGVDREPTRHEGPAVRAIEAREMERCRDEGREYEPVTERARENEAVRERNAMAERIREAIGRAHQRMRELAQRLRELSREHERERELDRERDRSPEGRRERLDGVVERLKQIRDDRRAISMAEERGHVIEREGRSEREAADEARSLLARDEARERQQEHGREQERDMNHEGYGYEHERDR